MSRTYRCNALWGGHGLARSHSWSNSTYATDSAYPNWQAGYTSSRYHTTAWTFDTSAPRSAVDGGAAIEEMYLVVRMSQLRAYTSWSLAYKGNTQTDGLAGTFTRVKRDQVTPYSAYGDYISLVRTGSYGCSVLEQGSNDNTTPDWLIRIDIPSSYSIPIYGLTIGAYNSSTTSRYYNFPTDDFSDVELVIVTDEEEPVPPPPPTPSGKWSTKQAMYYDGKKWQKVNPSYYDGKKWVTVTSAIYGG